MFLQDTKVGDERSFCLKICLNPYRFCISTFILCTLSDGKGLNLHQFILYIAQSDLFRMTQSSQPVRIRMHHVELVMAA